MLVEILAFRMSPLSVKAKKSLSSLSKCAILLQSVTRLREKRQRRQFLQSLTQAEVRCLLELLLNIVRQRVPIRACDRRRLEKHSPLIRKLLAEGKSVADKKKLLVQHGGFLPFLVPIIAGITSALPAIGTALGITSGIAGTAAGAATLVRSLQNKK